MVELLWMSRDEREIRCACDIWYAGDAGSSEGSDEQLERVFRFDWTRQLILGLEEARVCSC